MDDAPLVSSQASASSDGANPKKRKNIIVDSDESEDEGVISNGASVSNNSSFQSTSSSSSEYHIPKKYGMAIEDDVEDIDSSDGMLVYILLRSQAHPFLNLSFYLSVFNHCYTSPFPTSSSVIFSSLARR